jgi:2-C-methyl-D-erythritol 4-phosphate cytidylyltransferase / 2-C-methyl-D-erythritol 2,4-cyclodiphosphate synthase
MMHVSVIVVAAGKGERAGGLVPKQFAPLAGKAVLLHAVDTFLDHPDVGSTHLVVGPGHVEHARALVSGRAVTSVLEGGAERRHSVLAGLVAADAAGATHVLIHDAARPLLTHAVIDRLISALSSADGAVPVLPVADTLARGDQGSLGELVDRSNVWRVQTPQAFAMDAIMTSHRVWAGGNPTDDAQMARAAGFHVVAVEGDAMLEKITHAADFELAELRLASTRISRTGMGYDVHRLEAGRPLWLAGVRIEHDKGLSGHSDADVALHALVDALLGTLGEGDIGSHFPPSDPQWKGAESWRFLQHARALIDARGGIIDHVDLTIICEEPRIGPHREAMRQRIAELLAIDPAQVSVKATTTERLGFTGRGEGIAAQAIATVRL